MNDSSESLCPLASGGLWQENRGREREVKLFIFLVPFLGAVVPKLCPKTKGHCCSQGGLFSRFFLLPNSGNLSPRAFELGVLIALLLPALGPRTVLRGFPETCPHFIIRPFNK